RAAKLRREWLPTWRPATRGVRSFVRAEGRAGVEVGDRDRVAIATQEASRGGEGGAENGDEQAVVAAEGRVDEDGVGQVEGLREDGQDRECTSAHRAPSRSWS